MLVYFPAEVDGLVLLVFGPLSRTFFGLFDPPGAALILFFCFRVNKRFIATPPPSVVCKPLSALWFTSVKQTLCGMFRNMGRLVGDPGVEGRDSEYTK